MDATPPPLPQHNTSWPKKFMFGIVGVAAAITFMFFACYYLGFIRTFRMPTGSMTPAISPGDHIIAEKISYFFREPRRNDLLVFKTDSIAALPPGQIYVKRLIAEPNTNLRITNGQVFIDGKCVGFTNCAGQINFTDIPPFTTIATQSDYLVPAGAYFVVGDNTTNSADSRSWGPVPSQNVVARAFFCYWPPGRLGPIK